MTEIRFYHLKTQALERALPQILAKAYETGKHIVVQMRDDKQAARLNEDLWTYRADSFLPHGLEGDEFSAVQPIMITTKDENPNNAKILILTGGATTAHIEDYELCCEMLEDHDTSLVEAARARWVSYKEAGHELTYWEQNAAGGWDKRA